MIFFLLLGLPQKLPEHESPHNEVLTPPVIFVHIEDQKVQKSLEELGLHCEDFHVLGVFEADPTREKKS
jgi:hypothetical protein